MKANRSLVIASIFMVLLFERHSGAADFSAIPPAVTVEDSQATFDARADVVLRSVAAMPIEPFDFDNGGKFASVTLAKLMLGVDVEDVNSAILDPATAVYGLVGSDFRMLSPFCRRVGDYDFALRGLIALAYRMWDRPELLWPRARHKLLHELLNTRGNKVRTKIGFSAEFCGAFPETENHILMTETSRYLTNQLLLRDGAGPGFDNELNGMNRWMLRYLKRFLVNDFEEFNSRPYQAYAVMPIQNLYEFAEDVRVRESAAIVLDYLAAKFAVSSMGLRRSVPFRRQPGYEKRTDMLGVDQETLRFISMAGNTQHLGELPQPFIIGSGLSIMLPAALGSYRIDSPLLDLVVRGPGESFQRFKHLGVEIYARSRSFLISAGGMYINMPHDFWTHELDAWGVPTTVMPVSGGIDRSEFIRIDGHRDPRKRVNTCVAPGFACGLNPVVPAFIPQECRRKVGDWVFVDFTSAECPLKYGFYAAVFSATCDTRACRKAGGRFGFMEIAEARPDMGFEEFRARVLADNGGRRYFSDRTNLYLKSDGTPIEFVPQTRSSQEWGIRSIGFKPVEKDIGRWPLAEGDVMTASGDGLVTVSNRALDKKLFLDLRDPLRPRRHWE